MWECDGNGVRKMWIVKSVGEKVRIDLLRQKALKTWQKEKQNNWTHNARNEECGKESKEDVTFITLLITTSHETIKQN